jgi:MFS family permease
MFTGYDWKQKMSTSSEPKEKPENVPLYALFGANIVSYVGDVMMDIAIPWFVLQTTGSITKTGITAFFTTLPIILSAFFGSALVDRLGYKRASVISDLVSGISVALIPLLYSTIGLAFWELLLFVFLAGLCQTPGSTARISLLPDLVAKSSMPLERANAATDGIRRVSRFIGAPLAGVLIAFIGTSNLLWIDDASFFISALLIGVAISKTPAITARTTVRQYFSDIMEGLHFIRRTPLILAITLTIMITNMLDEAHFAVVLPDYVRHFFGTAIVLGVLTAALGGAAFVGTVIFGAIGHRLPRRLTFAVCFILLSARFWVMALVPPLSIIIASNIISGLAAGPLNPIMYTVEQEQVPPEMRARVFGTTTAGGFLGMPIGVILSGYLVQFAGLRLSLFIIGACYLLTTTSLLVNPALRKIEKAAA